MVWVFSVWAITLNRYLRLAVLLVSVQCVACTSESEPVNDIGRWQITDSFILSAALSKQGQHTALLFPQGRLAVWDNDTQKRLIDWHAPDVLPDTSMMHMDESARYLLSATRTVVQIWDATSAEPAGSLDLSAQLGDASITSLRFILAPHSFVIGTSGGDILFADTRSDEYHLAHQHDADVVKLIVSPDGELFSAGNDGLVVRWDEQNKAPEQTLTVPHRVTSLEVGRDNNVFVSDALETQVIWQSQHNEIISELAYWERFQWFRVARFAPVNPWLITSSPKTEMIIWQLPEGNPIAQWWAEAQGFGSTVLDMRFTNPATLRTVTSDGVLQDWDIADIAEQSGSY
ncbi:MAG TPA: hypothetical protein DEH24_07525 [Alteromonas sp.]|nr:hypothetical protein [Alteromonas sp.]